MFNRRGKLSTHYLAVVIERSLRLNNIWLAFGFFFAGSDNGSPQIV